MGRKPPATQPRVPIAADPAAGNASPAVEDLTIRQLLSFLEPSSETPPDLDRLERALISREEAMKDDLTLLEVEKIELQREVVALRIKCAALEEELKRSGERIGDLASRKKRAESEAELWKRKFEERHLVIDISDSEDDTKKGSKATDLEVGGKNVDAEVEDEDKDFLLVPTPKRKSASRVVVSESEGEDDDDDDDDEDRIPIGRLKRQKRIGESSGGLSVDLSSGHASRSRRRLRPLRDSIARKSSPTDGKRSRKKTEVYRKLGYSDTEDAEEDEVDAGSEREGDSLSGFIVSESDGSEGESSSKGIGKAEGSESDSSSNDVLDEESDSDVSLGDVLAKLCRKKECQKWELEGDMLASLAKDHKLCMKAVCALYRRQTSEEKSSKETFVLNGRGFNTLHANRASTIAEFLMGGDPLGPLRKSVEELEEFDPSGLEYCHKLANHYSKQLFEIYQNKEDPFFLPS